jgi:hypothetical protein
VGGHFSHIACLTWQNNDVVVFLPQVEGLKEEKSSLMTLLHDAVAQRNPTNPSRSMPSRNAPVPLPSLSGATPQMLTSQPPLNAGGQREEVVDLPAVGLATEGPPLQEPQPPGPWSQSLMSVGGLWEEYNKGWKGNAPLREYYMDTGHAWKKKEQPEVTKDKWCKLESVVKGMWLYRDELYWADELLDKTRVPSIDTIVSLEERAIQEIERRMREGSFNLRDFRQKHLAAKPTKESRQRYLRMWEEMTSDMDEDARVLRYLKLS